MPKDNTAQPPTVNTQQPIVADDAPPPMIHDDIIMGSSVAPANDIVMPTVTTSDPNLLAQAGKKFAGGKIIATILGLFLLVGGVGAGVYLTQQNQNINEKADSCTPISFSNKNLEVYESTAGNYAVGYNFNLDSIVYGDIDIQTGAQEKYDLYRSDANGSPLATGDYISVYQVRNYISTEDSGNNIDSVVLIDKTTGVRSPATIVSSYMIGASGTGDGLVSNVLGEPDNKVTYMGDLQSRITVGFTTECQPTPVPTVFPTTPPTTAPTPTPPAITAQCQNVKAYSSTWTLLTNAQLSALTPNTIVNFCVTGSATGGSFDKAKFTINGEVQAETTTVRPSGTDFCQEYVIKNGINSYNVTAQIHHTTLGWK